MWTWSLSGQRLRALTSLAFASVTVRSLLAPSARRVAIPPHGQNGYSRPAVFVPYAPSSEGHPSSDGLWCRRGRRARGIDRPAQRGGAPGLWPSSSLLLLSSSSSPPSPAARGDEAAAASDGTTGTGEPGSLQEDKSVAADGKKRSRTLYEILNVPPDATPVELKRAYVALARLCHPDVLRRRDQEQDPGDLDFNFAEIAAAYRVLSNPKERLRYDRSLRAEEFGADAEKKMTEITESAVQIFDEVALPFLERTAATTVNFDRAARANINKVNKGAKWLSFRARREMIKRKRRDAELEKRNAEQRSRTKGSEDTRAKHIRPDIDNTDAGRETRPLVVAPSAAHVEGGPSTPSTSVSAQKPPLAVSNATRGVSQAPTSSTTASSVGDQQPEAAAAIWATKDGISWSLTSEVSASSVTAQDPATAPTMNVTKRDGQSFASSNSTSSAYNATGGNHRSPPSRSAASSVAFQPPLPPPPSPTDDTMTVDSISASLFSLEEKELTPSRQDRSKSHDTKTSHTRERSFASAPPRGKAPLVSTGSSAPSSSPSPDRTEQRLSRMWERVNKLKERADALERSKGSYGRGMEK